MAAHEGWRQLAGCKTQEVRYKGQGTRGVNGVKTRLSMAVKTILNGLFLNNDSNPRNHFSPELTGIGKYSGEMAEWLAAPPYYET